LIESITMAEFLIHGKYCSILEKKELIFSLKAGFGFPAYSMVSDGEDSGVTDMVMSV